MNTWDQRFASCEAAQEDEDAIDDGQSEKKLSFREIIFNAEGKYRPPFSERSAVSSIFAVGTTTVNGRDAGRRGLRGLARLRRRAPRPVALPAAELRERPAAAAPRRSSEARPARGPKF